MHMKINNYAIIGVFDTFILILAHAQWSMCTPTTRELIVYETICDELYEQIKLKI